MKKDIITQIIEGEYGDLFQNDVHKIPLRYKELCKLVHPDSCEDERATDAFTKLNQMYQTAVDAATAGTWVKKNYVEFKTTNGKTLQIPYLYCDTFELGTIYVCPTHIIYLFDFSKKKYYNNYIKEIKNLSYANGDMEKMFKPLFPEVVSEHDTTDGKHIIALKKTDDVFPLKCVVENFYNGKVPATHMAWMISRLLNISCYLKYSNKVHNGLNLNNLFVSLQYHTILVEGGWWYSVAEDTAMIGTTKDIFNVMPPKVKADKVACSTTDIESIKSFGRKYIADDAPKAFLDFLNSGSGKNSMKEMEKWDKALYDSFGKRKFIKIKATKNEIYKTK